MHLRPASDRRFDGKAHVRRPKCSVRRLLAPLSGSPRSANGPPVTLVPMRVSPNAGGPALERTFGVRRFWEEAPARWPIKPNFERRKDGSDRLIAAKAEYTS